jgi:hypothetical protein
MNDVFIAGRKNERDTIGAQEVKTRKDFVTAVNLTKRSL